MSERLLRFNFPDTIAFRSHWCCNDAALQVKAFPACQLTVLDLPFDDAVSRLLRKRPLFSQCRRRGTVLWRFFAAVMLIGVVESLDHGYMPVAVGIRIDGMPFRVVAGHCASPLVDKLVVGSVATCP